MKVALITPDLPHYRENLYRIFAADSTVNFVHFSDTQETNGIASVPVASLEKFVAAPKIKIGPLYWQKGVIKAALDSSYDRYIMTGDYRYISTWIAGLIVRSRKKPLFFWTMGWRRPETAFKKIFRNTFYSIANKLMVYGEMGKNLGISQGFPSSKIFVVFNSVTNQNDVKIDPTNFEKKINAVGAIGRLNNVKNLPLLIEALGILKQRGVDVKAILAGAGPEKSTIEKRASELGVSCEFLGAIYEPAEIGNFYERVKVTVVPAAIGLTAIQSLAHGVPVITDNEDRNHGPEVDAIVSGVTGERYSAGQPNELADLIELWINKVSSDPIGVAKACTDEFENHWTPQVQANRMLEVLKS